MSCYQRAISDLAMSNSWLFSDVLLAAFTIFSNFLVGFWYAQPLVGTVARDGLLAKRGRDILRLMEVVASASLEESLDFTDLYAWTQTASLALIAIPLLSLALIVHLAGKWLKSSFLLWLDEAIEGTNVGSISRNSVGVAGSACMLIQLQAMLHLLVVAVTTLAVVGASSVAIAQKEIKKVVAYSSISHKGYVFSVLEVVSLAFLGKLCCA